MRNLVETAKPTEQLKTVVVCLGTLFLFVKVRPALIKNYVEVLYPFLNFSLNPANQQSAAPGTPSQIDQTVVHYVVKIIELALPHAPRSQLSESYLTRLEDTLAKLIQRSSPLVCFTTKSIVLRFFSLAMQ